MRRLLTRALRAASPSIEHLARQLACSTAALRAYRLGTRRPSAAFVRSLAALLRRQSQRLETIAGQLENALSKEGTDA